MRLPAVANGVSQPAASIAVFGYGPFGRAVASLLAAGGQRVHLAGGDELPPETCDIATKNGLRYSTAVNFEQRVDASAAIRQSNAVIVAASGTEYGAVAEDLSSVLTGGQVILIVGAAFGASFEIAQILSARRPELALNIVESSRPFSRWEAHGKNVQISGLNSSFTIAGRTLNETRAGLSAASGILPSVVPASNILERAFADADKWLATAQLLFTVFKGAGQLTANPVGAAVASAAGAGGAQNFAPETSFPSSAVSAVVCALHAEIAGLARAFRVSNVPELALPSVPNLPPDYKRLLGQSVVEDFVILSELARLMYLPVPVIDSVIELSSVVTGLDLRREGRHLDDLGFVGMDAREIVEHVSA